MRKTVKRAGVVGLLALGAWLATLFDWSGGIGEDGSDGTLSRETQVSEIIPASRRSETDVTPAEPVPGPEVLTVVVEEQGYRLAADDQGAGGETVSLAEVRTRAQSASPGSQGVKVRILKSRYATAGMLSQLKSALAEAEVKQEEIQEQEKFID